MGTNSRKAPAWTPPLHYVVTATSFDGAVAEEHTKARHAPIFLQQHGFNAIILLLTSGFPCLPLFLHDKNLLGRSVRHFFFQQSSYGIAARGAGTSPPSMPTKSIFTCGLMCSDLQHELEHWAVLKRQSVLHCLQHKLVRAFPSDIHRSCLHPSTMKSLSALQWLVPESRKSLPPATSQLVGFLYSRKHLKSRCQSSHYHSRQETTSGDVAYDKMPFLLFSALHLVYHSAFFMPPFTSVANI